jgi:epoxyqueuosine reductase
MDWMARTLERRADPFVLWPDAKSVVVCAVNYAPPEDPLMGLERRETGMIASYARGRDYHDTVKKRLKRLGRWMAETHACEVKVFVDTAPVMEKPLAARSGLGWQGKHTNLVSTAFGSWLMLGEIFTTLDLPEDAPETDHCGSCTACLDACPTDALDHAYRIEARACLSYLTIEHKGEIPEKYRSAMGNRIFGCDDCLAVCPWTKFGTVTEHGEFEPKSGLDSPAIKDLAELDDAAFRELFAGTSVKRTGRDRFVRNVAITIGNSGDKELAGILRKLEKDASALVREAAAWARERLG